MKNRTRRTVIIFMLAAGLVLSLVPAIWFTWHQATQNSGGEFCAIGDAITIDLPQFDCPVSVLALIKNFLVSFMYFGSPIAILFVLLAFVVNSLAWSGDTDPSYTDGPKD